MAQKLVTTSYTKQITVALGAYCPNMYTMAIALIKSWVPFRKPFFQWSNWHFAKCELAIFLDQAWGDLMWMRLKNCALGAGAWDDVKKFLQLVYSEKAAKLEKNHIFIWDNITSKWIWRYFKFWVAFLE